MDASTQKRLVLIYFSFFPATHALGPAITIERLASRMAKYMPTEILTLNYDETTRKALFEEPDHSAKHPDGYTITYLPRNGRIYREIYKRLRSIDNVICINCMFDYRLAIPALLTAKFLSSSKTLFHFPHGIFLDAVFAQKRLKKKLFCRAAGLLGLTSRVVHIASSKQEAADIGRSFTTPQQVVVLPHFGQSPRADVLKDMAPKQSGQLRLCFAGRIAVQKNVIGAIDILSRVSVPCELDIIGAVEDEAYHRRCLERIKTLPEHVSVRFLGYVSHDRLMDIFSNYHLFFFPTLGENYGHSILEALACGLPALISDQTPWTDLEEHGAGWVFALSCPDRFVEVLEKTYRAGAEFSRAGAVAYAKAAADPPGLEKAVLDAVGVDHQID